MDNIKEDFKTSYLNIVAKGISILSLVLTVNLLLLLILDLSMFPFKVVLTVVFIEMGVLLGACLHKFILHPLYKLSQSLACINFDKDIIDFTKVDCLEESGFSEIKFIISKYKYLVDIIAERINRYNSETHKSEHDALTGCYNRLHLDRVTPRYEQQNSLFIIFIDVNNLKKMNDIFGHEAGDALLKNAVSKMRFWDSYGDLYRVGGDEFMVVLMNKKVDFCKNLLEMWYSKVGVLNRDGDGFKCVLSYGTSSATKGCIKLDDMIKEADEKMYEMKVAIKKEFGEELR